MSHASTRASTREDVVDISGAALDGVHVTPARTRQVDYFAHGYGHSAGDLTPPQSTPRRPAHAPGPRLRGAGAPAAEAGEAAGPSVMSVTMQLGGRRRVGAGWSVRPGAGGALEMGEMGMTPFTAASMPPFVAGSGGRWGEGGRGGGGQGW